MDLRARFGVRRCPGVDARKLSRKFARGELESVQIDECELFRSWYRARKEGPKAK